MVACGEIFPHVKQGSMKDGKHCTNELPLAGPKSPASSLIGLVALCLCFKVQSTDFVLSGESSSQPLIKKGRGRQEENLNSISFSPPPSVCHLQPCEFFLFFFILRVNFCAVHEMRMVFRGPAVESQDRRRVCVKNLTPNIAFLCPVVLKAIVAVPQVLYSSHQAARYCFHCVKVHTKSGRRVDGALCEKRQRRNPGSHGCIFSPCHNAFYNISVGIAGILAPQILTQLSL